MKTDPVTYEISRTNKTFEELRDEVKKEMDNKDYSIAFLIKEFTKNEILRRSYLALVKKSPARVQDIYIECSFAEKREIYRKLYRLKALGLIYQIPVSSITIKKEAKTPQEEEIEKEFNDWSCKMHPTMKQYYEAKTNYWVLSEKGKNVNLINNALIIERGSGKHE